MAPAVSRQGVGAEVKFWARPSSQNPQMLIRCYSDNFWCCFLWERWRKGQKRRRRKRCQRVMLRTTRATREEAPLNSSYKEPAGSESSSASTWMWMVQESYEERSVVSVEAAMVLWREKSRLDWWMSADAFGVKQSISSSCLNISLSQIQQCQEILGSFENDQGTPPPPPC